MMILKFNHKYTYENLYYMRQDFIDLCPHDISQDHKYLNIANKNIFLSCYTCNYFIRFKNFKKYNSEAPIEIELLEIEFEIPNKIIHILKDKIMIEDNDFSFNKNPIIVNKDFSLEEIDISTIKDKIQKILILI